MMAKSKAGKNPLEAGLDGINLIEASAGTGKTYTIAGLFVRALLEQKLEVASILVVTFTEAATEELRGRIRSGLREAAQAFRARDAGDDLKAAKADEVLAMLLDRFKDNAAALSALDAAIHDFDTASIFTIHGFCNRILRENAFESGVAFDTELVTDDAEITRQITEDFWRRHTTGAADLYVEFLSGEGIGPDVLLGLARRQKGALAFRIIPDVNVGSGANEEAELTKALREALGKLRSAWPKARGEVRDLLIGASADAILHKKYTEDVIEVWCADVDAFCAADSTRLSLPEKFNVFTASGLVKVTFAKKRNRAPRHALFDLCGDVQQKVNALTELYGERIIPLKREFLEYVQEEYARIKADRCVQTFDDLLVNVHRALQGENGDVLAAVIHERYPIALIDEFQDTDPVQYKIFKRIYKGEKGTALFMIGDPKQSIYAFRGADVLSYVDAREDAGEKYPLGINWRSEEKLVRAVNTIFEAAENPFVFEKIPFSGVEAAPEEKKLTRTLTIDGKSDPPFRIWMLSRGRAGEQALKTSKNKPPEVALINKDVAREIIRGRMAEEIVRLINAGRDGKAVIGHDALKPGDIAVLVRSHREAGAFQEELRRKRVASVLYSDKSLMASREMTELQRILMAAASWRDGGLVKSALVTTILGVSGNELHAAMRDENAWEEHQSDFRDWHDLWRERGFIQMFRAMLARRDVARRLLALTDGERRLTNVLHAGELLQRAAVEQKLGMSGLLKWLADERKDSDSEVADERQLRLESDEKRVKVITMHRVKGLEFPVVFCPSLWDGYIHADDESLFHDPDNDYELTLDLGSDTQGEHRKVAVMEERAEALRLAYVALTRARNRCYAVVGPIANYDTSSLAYLFHQGDAATGEDLLVAAAGRAKEIADEDLEADLRALEKKAGGGVAVSLIPEAEDVKAALPEYGDPTALSAREFRGSISSEWRVTSYSGLVRGAHATHVVQDHDQHDLVGEQVSVSEEDSIFTFPRGAAPGSMMHALFEKLNFRADDATIRIVVGSELKRGGYDHERWGGVIEGMVKNVLSTPLNKDGLTLSSVGPEDSLCEMEFYYPLGRITHDGLAKTFKGKISGDVPTYMDLLTFSPRLGYMKGFVDLVFRSGGKYYILDYKSNFLGRTIEAYHRDRLGPEMAAAHYDLQYHVYTVALHRYLQKRLPGYDYEKNFGGVFYLFVRGMNPEKGCDHGVFFDRPTTDLTESLSKYLGQLE